ncbi:MAG TPA: flap endonuclease-1 [Methanospirillum sp.]|uniref:flap endonuclease-1 n=1 Tax=Methanospirillum sp. TaxID=45200 RepID=UPI002CB87EC5|nr:flap endonuclease-1 [Methanospirillum sp.]HOJ96571.1 flap endonuclease-1 [Methanospirillum sp.]HOL40420.1 flap endonuclease-1 [Methanospirillum sp.]HPP78158.1 flap endonuclease-1 [Methanospirillum sp.]
MGVALRDILADFKRPATPEDLRGVAAIDAFNAFYQFLSIIRQPDGTPLMDDEGRITSHLSGIFFRTANFLEQGICPVYVFDGRPPEMKSSTIRERRDVRDESKEKWDQAKKEGDLASAFRYAMSSSVVDAYIISSARTLIQFMGLPVVDAPSEGEAQAAYMVLKGDADYVVSQDYDTLLFGTPVLVRNLTISGKRRIHGRQVMVQPERIVLSDVLSSLAISREQLIEIAILTGTDFHPGVRGIGAKTGLKKIRSGEFESIIREKLPDFDPEPVRNFFMNPPVTDTYSLQTRRIDRDGIKTFLCEEHGFSKDRVEPVLDKISKKEKQRTLESWF